MAALQPALREWPWAWRQHVPTWLDLLTVIGGMREVRAEDAAAGFDYFEYDNAYFRRRRGKGGFSVDAVLHGDRWVPSAGDRSERGVFGSPCQDPLRQVT